MRKAINKHVELIAAYIFTMLEPAILFLQKATSDKRTATTAMESKTDEGSMRSYDNVLLWMKRN